MADDMNDIEIMDFIDWQHCFRKPRVVRPRSDDFAELDDEKFLQRYRLSKEAVELLLQEVRYAVPITCQPVSQLPKILSE